MTEQERLTRTEQAGPIVAERWERPRKTGGKPIDLTRWDWLRPSSGVHLLDQPHAFRVAWPARAVVRVDTFINTGDSQWAHYRLQG